MHISLLFINISPGCILLTNESSRKLLFTKCHHEFIYNSIQRMTQLNTISKLCYLHRIEKYRRLKIVASLVDLQFDGAASYVRGLLFASTHTPLCVDSFTRIAYIVISFALESTVTPSCCCVPRFDITIVCLMNKRSSYASLAMRYNGNTYVRFKSY